MKFTSSTEVASSNHASTICKSKIPTTISELGPFDVLGGRDRKCSSNHGNHQFRKMIKSSLHKYIGCKTKFERSKAIGAITKEIQNGKTGSIRFFKVSERESAIGRAYQDHDAIELLDEKQAREKVAHALRDLASRTNNEQKEPLTTHSMAQPVLSGLKRIVSDCSHDSNFSLCQHHHNRNHNHIQNIQANFAWIKQDKKTYSVRLNQMVEDAAAITAEIKQLEEEQEHAVGTRQNYESNPTKIVSSVVPLNEHFYQSMQASPMVTESLKILPGFPPRPIRQLNMIEESTSHHFCDKVDGEPFHEPVRQHQEDLNYSVSELMTMSCSTISGSSREFMLESCSSFGSSMNVFDSFYHEKPN